MIKKILIGFILLLGLSLHSQAKKAEPSLEIKVKNYVKWFESLPDYKKREESIILVNKLNRLTPHDKGVWLALISKYSTKEVKQNIPDSLTNDGVKKKLLREFKNSNYVQTNEKIDSIIILNATTGKERTLAKNEATIKRIAFLKAIIAKAEKKMDSIGGDVDSQYRNGNIEYMDAYHNSKNATYELPQLREKLILYQGPGDNNWNSYLIDQYEIEIHLLVPHKLTDEELDTGMTSTSKFDKKKKIYIAEFIRGTNYYKDNIRDDKLSRFNINEKVDYDDDDDE
ncbi:hypothetical protein BD847_2365 [Flavobacterium cutihirudinis]|uniref:Uncharacterized protein n=1 Tax=Flavobacterium cutihirudinis TaxID=1265740 RepID=A0A3D9FRQ8_9FLAO|nr:hypothetical protein [Flavobacterium cutihirudinis]RED23317.1 hypothetical protein BD847_2365 [Flavobacterium cutihirudinis]